MVVNRKKFIRSTSVIIGLIIFITLLCMNKSLSYTEITYKKVVVISGDSLWSIAKQEKENNMYYANKDIRAIIDELKYINHLSSSNLNIGDELDIPII